MTANQIVAAIQEKLAAQGIAWRADGRDASKAGNPAAVIHGIATTGMATFDVLRRASAARRNFVVTHEPTFYNDRDLTAGLETDPLYVEKQRFIVDHDMVVWRFHDHAHRLRPDPLVSGSARTLGWTAYASPSTPGIYVLPQTTLGALAADVSRRLNDHAIRVVGNPDMKVSRVALGPGYGVPPLTADIDVAVGGEAAETAGNAEYALDAAEAGTPKGMILLGHMLSEDHGMKEVADWLRTFVSEVPVEFVPAGEPFIQIR
jgi:putative NIF3 family GTP cyclohydrolase 1 type 2